MQTAASHYILIVVLRIKDKSCWRGYIDPNWAISAAVLLLSEENACRDVSLCPGRWGPKRNDKEKRCACSNHVFRPISYLNEQVVYDNRSGRETMSKPGDR